MPATDLKRCLALVLLLAAASVGYAGHGQHWALHFGRWSGYGWGEGYHAREAMPPRRHPHTNQAWHQQWFNAPPEPTPSPLPVPKPVEALPLPLPPVDAPIILDESR